MYISRPQTSKVLSSQDWKVGQQKGQDGAQARARHQDLIAHCHLPHRTPGLIEQRKAPPAAAGPHLAHEASAPEKRGGEPLRRARSCPQKKQKQSPILPSLAQLHSRAECEGSRPGLPLKGTWGPQRSPWRSGMGRLFSRVAALSATAVRKLGTFPVRFSC